MQVTVRERDGEIEICVTPNTGGSSYIWPITDANALGLADDLFAILDSRRKERENNAMRIMQERIESHSPTRTKDVVL